MATFDIPRWLRTVIGLKKANGQVIVTDQESANVFCDYFNEVFVKEGNWNTHCVHEKMPPEHV